VDVSGLHCFDFAPHRVGAGRGIKAPVDTQDHIGLPGEYLLGRDVDDRARAGILADDIVRTDEVDDLAADRADYGRLEPARSAGDVHARTPGQQDLGDRFLHSAQ